MKRLIPILLALATTYSDAMAQADYIIHNARIYTVDDALPTAEAMAVRGERILMLGSDERLLQTYPDARRIDLEGSVVIPGLIDAHAHLMGRAMALLQADLVGTRSKKEVIERLQEFAERLPQEAWLTGRGWDQNDWPEQAFPTREDLDAAFPSRPVWIRRIDGHAAWANTAALEAAGLNEIRSAADPEGGRIVRDASGEPSGIFIDTAMRLVDRHVPDPGPDERREGLRLALEETARYGLTGVHDAGIPLEDVDAYRAAIDRGEFPIRVYGMIGGVGPTLDHFCREGPILGYGGRLTVRAVKLYADGALGSRGAALLEPYSDEPDTRGLLRVDEDALTDEVVRAMSCGFQVGTHAIGDRANRVVLNAYERALERLGTTSGRHRIEHAQIVHPDDIPRFRELGVTASMQPTHATSDMYWAEDRVGSERLQGAYAWQTFLDYGVRVAFGSDFPVEDVNPLLGFYAAVTRQDAEGWPPGGWLPHQRVSRLEALRGFTIDAAYAAFQEHEVGSLEAGKYADFVVLSDDILTIPPEQILNTRVIATYLSGERIYHVDESTRP